MNSIGRPNIWPPASTVITRAMMMLNGRVKRTAVPFPGSLAIVTRPPIRATAERTASIPTPRPEICVTVAAVEKPGEKIKSIASASLIAANSSGEAMFWRAAVRRSFATSMPAPSSDISTMTRSPSRSPRSRISPIGGFPAARRPASGSTP